MEEATLLRLFFSLYWSAPRVTPDVSVLVSQPSAAQRAAPVFMELILFAAG